MRDGAHTSPNPEGERHNCSYPCVDIKNSEVKQIFVLIFSG